MSYIWRDGVIVGMAGYSNIPDIASMVLSPFSLLTAYADLEPIRQWYEPIEDEL